MNLCTSMYVSAYGCDHRFVQSLASTSAYKSTTASKPDTGKPLSSMPKKDVPSAFCARKSFVGFDAITFNSPGVGLHVCTYSPDALLSAYVTFSSPKPGNFPDVDTTFPLASKSVTVSLLPTLNFGLVMPSPSQHKTSYAFPARTVPTANVNFSSAFSGY